MKKNNLIYCLLGMVAMGTMSSCSDGEPRQDSGYIDDADYINVIPATRKAGDVSWKDDTEQTIYKENEAASKLLEDGFNLGDILYMSQVGATVNPDFRLNNDEENFVNENLYHYVYEERTNQVTPSWTEGYNFFANEKKDLIDWQQIRNNGPFGNGFALYAMFFPKVKGLEKNMPRFFVAHDQTELDSLRISNIMGAYHSTSSLNTRLRFWLYHLTSYIRVTVYIPVLKTEVNPNTGKNVTSGFEGNAMQKGEAKILGVNPRMSIEWRDVALATDGSPSATAYTPPAGSDETVESIDIPLYWHDFVDENGNLLSQPPIIKDLPINTFYPGDNGTDEVYKYEFSVLIPQQGWSKEQNFLRFKLKTYTNTIKTYVFNDSQFVTSQDAQFNSGQLYHIYLYLPRRDGEAVLVGATVDPWIDATVNTTDMEMSQEKTETPNPENPDEGDDNNGDDSGDTGDTGGNGGGEDTGNGNSNANTRR